VSVKDICGDLHCHSDWTDGTAPIADMAAAAQAHGYEYMALTDHSRRQAMSHGLDPARVSQQIRELDKLNAKFKGFTILKGIEVDILKDGSLDLPDSTLAKLDVVVASVHSFFDLPREGQTERVIRAMQNPHVHIIGHPTGRLIGEREPFEIDMDRVLSAAADLKCYLEINSQPERLDLNDLHAHAAKTKGVKLSVSTDAHSTNSFDYIRFGIDQARRAWLTAGDVINSRSLANLRKLLKR
jgi:DNA polymerase (family 10)